MLGRKVVDSVYVHIPFCITKCLYCAFPVFALGRRHASAENQHLINDYVKTLGSEIRAHFESNPNFQHYRSARTPLRSLYLGGGTPSLLSGANMRTIYEALSTYFLINNATEFTMECNPETIDSEKLSVISQIGINRLSVGVQLCDDKFLKYMNRSHRASDILRCAEILRKSTGPFSNLSNVSFDILINYPETLASEAETAHRDPVSATQDFLRSYQPEHLSLYSMQVVEGSRMHDMMLQLGQLHRCEDGDRSQPRILQFHKFLTELGYK